MGVYSTSKVSKVSRVSKGHQGHEKLLNNIENGCWIMEIGNRE